MKKINNGWSQETYIKAYRFAAEKHKGQLVPGTEWSYLAHLSMVSMEIMAALNYEADMNGNLAVQAAILHDTIEDTDTTYEELVSDFGQRVADGVLALTKDENIEKQDQMSDSLRRIKLQPIEIWMVKMADRITNLQPPPPYWTTEKRKKYLDQAKLILDELKFGSDFLSKRLNEKIQLYQSYI
ncbi:HD domain-containing protein [uncultured Desulfobacter sp.]|uniref:HD domain-containing protein n=2 Tax=Desulfobacter TaxID=2289 RepID=UPI00259B36E2|nr:HD domain-containing protein [uncultured Desulfobacter sp.]